MPTVRRNDVKLELTICPCGSVFLTYGALTANFSVEEFFAFADKVTQMASVVRNPNGTEHSRLFSTVWN
ncbi:MAG TPA: hypothetical protein VHQ67_03610 [Nitrospiraceae bacterium]|nr:hypothetical protein [Nitrospiraceae bacterium]